ncbi:MAG TPA: ABC transporter substrate-binding protein [Aggregatilineales bacterium]|nr:ABC transporter substrate-binding protein [Aggregatilineales bacterium]
MLRGFRWQFLVLVTAFLLFAASLMTRLTSTPAPLPTNTPAPTLIAEVPTALPTPVAVDLPQTVNSIPTLSEALIGQVQRLNPLLANLNPVDQDISSLIFEGLTRINAFGEAVPSLARRWFISSDGLEYVFELREDVLWQDGTPFTGADVLYTIGLLQSPDFPGEPELAAFWRTVEIQQLGLHLVRFRLTQSLGSFLDHLRIGILPEHALRGTNATGIASHPFNLAPIGTGPYQLEALRTSGDQIVQIDLRPAPTYRARPGVQSSFGLERLSFRLYPTFEAALNAVNNGEVMALASRNRAERAALLNSDLNIYTGIEPSVGVLLFNWERETTRYFNELRVRGALQRSLDRNGIIERNLLNQAVLADSPLLPGSWAYEPAPWPAVDLDAARELLATARLRTSGSDATPEPTVSGAPILSFSLMVLDEPALVQIATEISAQWSQLNVQVTVDPVSAATLQQRLEAGDFDTVIAELSLSGSADPDVYQFWDQGRNYGGVNDRRTAEDLERARRDPNGLNRAEFYRQFQIDFVERAIAIPLYYPLFTYAVSPQISGVQLGFLSSPASRFLTITDWVSQ